MTKTLTRWDRCHRGYSPSATWKLSERNIMTVARGGLKHHPYSPYTTSVDNAALYAHVAIASVVILKTAAAWLSHGSYSTCLGHNSGAARTVVADSATQRKRQRSCG